MKIFDILKARWPEAVMVAGLQACCVAMLIDLRSMSQPQPQTVFARFVFMGIGTMVFWVICQMIFWGFLRSVAVGCTQPVEPMTMLRTGRVYFWRILLFQLLLLPAIVLINLIIQVGVQTFLYGKVTPQPVLWLSVVGDTTAGLILMKPAFLIPAMILLRECGIWDALRNLRQVRLSEMRYFRTLTAGILIIAGVAEYVSGLVGRKDILYYPAMASDAIISAAGMLVVFMAAVIGVGWQMPAAKPNEPNENETK